MHDHFHRLAPAVALCLPLLAAAQTSRSDPADARAPAPALRYSSAFADYKPWQDIKTGDWRAVNDQVRDAASGAAQGGPHAGHASPAPAPIAAPAPAAKASAPTMPGHGRHHMPGSRP
jgi:hypothetical protein